MDAPPPPTVVDVGLGQRQARPMWGLAIGLVVVGVVVIASNVGGGTRPTALGATAFGAVLVVLGLLLARAIPKLLRPRRLVLDEQGIRLLDEVGKPFDVAWGELLQVRASYARKPGPVRSPLSWGGVTDDAAPDGTLEHSFGVSTYVRVDLVPADPAFLERHPGMRGYRRLTGRPAGTPVGVPWAEDVGDQQAVIRVPFGDQPQLLAPVDAALRAHAGARYHPPVNEGLALGFRYS